jgi:hypothetical protein
VAPPINPQILAALMQQGGGPNIGNAPVAPPPIAGGAPTGPLPPTSPVQPAGGGIDLASIVGQISNLPAYQQSSSRLEDIGRQEQDIQKQMGSMTLPKMGPQIEKGAGFFHNLGQALLLASEMTRPGQAVNQAIYGPGMREYATRQGALSKQLEALKEQEAIPTEELRATTGLAQAGGLLGYRQGQLGVQQERNRIQQERVDAYARSVDNRFQTAMRGLDLNALRTGSQVELNKFRERLMQVQTELAPQKLELEKYGIDANNETRLAAANLMSQLGIDKTHPLAQTIDSILGTSLVPAAPQAPAGTAPVSGAPGTPPARTPANTPAKRRTIDLTK